MLRKEAFRPLLIEGPQKTKKKKNREEMGPEVDFYNHLKLTVVDPDTIGKLTKLMQETVKIELTSERMGKAMLNINYR
jgi:hypothetical protein